jgi:tetratricopeptide (TPR) repeat protein
MKLLNKLIETPVCLFFTLSLLLLTANVQADLDSDIQQLQTRWAQVNYQMKGDSQIQAFKALKKSAGDVISNYPDAAPAWIWRGIIKSTFAGAKGGLGALSLAKSAKKDLEKSLTIDSEAMHGSAYASLGTLYFSVPGWPIGFGDDDKAEELLLKALTLNPDGIDSNYFYGDFLLDENRYAEANDYFLKAQQAPARPLRPIADQGRHQDITKKLKIVTKKLN